MASSLVSDEPTPITYVGTDVAAVDAVCAAARDVGDVVVGAARRDLPVDVEAGLAVGDEDHDGLLVGARGDRLLRVLDRALERGERGRAALRRSPRRARCASGAPDASDVSGTSGSA